MKRTISQQNYNKYLFSQNFISDINTYFYENHHFMKKQILLLSFAFIACNASSEKEGTKADAVITNKFKMPTSLEQGNLKGKIKKIIEYNYTAELKNGQYIKSNDLFYTITTVFNENGEITEKEVADYKGKKIVRTQKYLCVIINDSTQIVTMYLNGKRTNKHILTWRDKYTQTDSLLTFLTPEDSIGTIKKVGQDEYDSQYRIIRNTVLLSDDDPNDHFYSYTKTENIYKADTVIAVFDDNIAEKRAVFMKVITTDSYGNKTQVVSTYLSSNNHYIKEFKYEYYQ